MVWYFLPSTDNFSTDPSIWTVFPNKSSKTPKTHGNRSLRKDTTKCFYNFVRSTLCKSMSKFDSTESMDVGNYSAAGAWSLAKKKM